MMGISESEARLEDRMIDQLVKQGYSKVVINDVSDLEKNFREQVNIHNKIELKNKDLSDKEFERLMVKISDKGIFQSDIDKQKELGNIIAKLNLLNPLNILDRG